MCDINLFVLNTNTLQDHHLAKNFQLIQIKTTFLWIDIQRILSKLIKNPPNGLKIIYFLYIDHIVI